MTAPNTRPRADLPTLMLHWALVVSLLISISTGWRIAAMTDGSAMLRWVDALLLQGNVVRWHFLSATALTALVVAYVAFLVQQGLGARLTFRRAALSSPDRTTRWTAINKLIYWIPFALLAGAALTGVLVYFFPGLLPNEPLMWVHKLLSWAFVFYVVLHVVAQLLLGGLRQLLKIVTPRMAYGLGAGVALGVGVAGVALAYVADRSGQMTLEVGKVDAAPVLDGTASDALWAQAPEVVVHTSRGLNAKGPVEVPVHVKALHNGEQAFFQFRWPDATRSQKHTPVQKTADGWVILNNNFGINDETHFYEDKFSVLLAQSPIAAGNTMQVGPKPLADKPAPSNGLGLHATTDGSLADMWHWKSVRTGVLNQLDDNHFGPPTEPKAKGGRYTGGYSQDPKTAGGYEQIFSRQPDTPIVKLKYLPKNLQEVQARMGPFDPDHNVSDMGFYAIAKTEVQPYTEEADAAIPVGTVLPSVVYDKPFEGDRGDVTVHAQWKDGWWTLEATRLLNTQSQYDQPIADGMYMWVAVFDHAQVRHTRHVLPLKLRLQ